MTDLYALRRQIAERLVNADSPMTDASELIQFTLGFSKTDILKEPKRDIDAEKLQLLNSLTEKRALGYPLQYILGEWDFFGRTFLLSEGVLIPRSETEQIADTACRFLKNKKNAVVFDICCGSGCIGLSVAANNPQCQVYLLDISQVALRVAQRNKDRFSLDNATIFDYDIFSGFRGDRLPRPDVILCNPPYVTQAEYENLQQEIFYEPKEAIVAPGDGLVFYRCLAEKWLDSLSDGGFFMLESGEGQPEKIVDILRHNARISANFGNMKTENDIYGVSRFVCGIKNGGDR